MSNLCRLIWYTLFANVDRLVFAGLYRLAPGVLDSPAWPRQSAGGLSATKEGNMARVLLCGKIAGVATWLLGSLLLGPTTAMAEYDVKSALLAYDSADLDNRKVWELIFGNPYKCMRWADAALVNRKQQQLFCEPNNVALTGPH